MPLAQSAPPRKVKSKRNRKKSIKEIRAEIQNKATAAPTLVAMRSETQAVQKVDEKDRDARIAVAVGMVVADMKALQGQDVARKATLSFKSEKMMEHVGRICDEASRQRNECPEKRITSPVALEPTSAPSTFDIKRAPTAETAPLPAAASKSDKWTKVKASGTRKGLRSKSQKNVSVTKAKAAQPKVDDTAKSLGEILSEVAEEMQLKSLREVAGARRSIAKIANPSNTPSPPKPQVTNLTVRKRNSAVAQATPSTVAKKLETVRAAADAVSIKKTELYQTSIDLLGFTNENISLDLEGRRIIVVAYRPKDSANHARKVTEIVEIPEGVEVDNLKVSRRPDGSLNIEEVLPEAQKS